MRKIIKGILLTIFILSLLLLGLKTIEGIILPLPSLMLFILAVASVCSFYLMNWSHNFMRVVRDPFTSIFLFLIIVGFGLSMAGLGKNAPSGENREMAPYPAFPTDSEKLKRFPAEFEAAFNDHFPFRRIMVHVHSRILYDAFGVSSHKDVVIGKRKWLFFRGDEAMDDYLGNVPFNAQAVDGISKSIATLRDASLAEGKRFLFVIAPDKQSVYPEYLPGHIDEGGPKRLDQLLPTLDALGVEYLDLRSDIVAAKAGGEDLYYKNDTHWNTIGGFYAFRSIMKTLGLGEFERGQAEVVRESGGFQGDMAATMLGLTKIREDDFLLAQMSVAGRSFFPAAQSETNDGKARLIRTQNEEGNGKRLLLLRDSFSIALLPYLSACFYSVDAVWPLSHENMAELFSGYIKASSADLVVFVLVQRGLDWLIE